MQGTRDRLLSFFKLNQTVVSAKGGLLWLENGEVVYDFLSQYGANPLGANDDDMLDAAIRFLSAGEPTLCQPLTGSHVVALKKRLLKLCKFDNGETLFCQSGTESVELAIKIARSATGNKYTIALENGFHGKTTGSVQLTANPEYREYFGVTNEFVRHLSTDPGRELEDDFAALTQDGKVNAIVIEFVQGEGGMQELDKSWVQRLIALAQAKDILVIADEIQTGLGRTGTLFAHEHYEIKPDMVLLAKALGGGIAPLGACITAPGLCPPEFTLYHSSTFANNNFTCSIANALLDRLEGGLIDAVKQTSDYLDEQLNLLVLRYPDVYSKATGKGLMRGLHLCEQKDLNSYVSNFQWNSGLTAYAAAGWLLRTQQILLMPCFSKPSCLRIQPPLNSDRKHIDKVTDALELLARLLRKDIGACSLIDPDLDSIYDLRTTGKKNSGRNRANALSPVNQIIADSTKSIRRFQFALHPLETQSCLLSLPDVVDTLSENQRQRYNRRVIDILDIAQGFSEEGYSVEPFRLGDQMIEGRLFFLNMTAKQIMQATGRQRKMALRALANAAQQYNPMVYGLGAFTSIITQGGFLLRDLKQRVTTGSSLTAYAAVQAALSTPSMLTPARFGVIGANGSVGALCWQMLFCQAAVHHPIAGVSLFYNPDNPKATKELANSIRRAVADWQTVNHSGAVSSSALADIAREYERNLKRCDTGNSHQLVDAFSMAVAQVMGADFLRIAASNDLTELQQLDRILVATNRVDGVDELNFTRNDALIYDIGYPLSFNPDEIAASGRSVYSAGLVKLPDNREFGKSNIAQLPPGISLGCFAETMTLAATDPTATPQGVGIKLSEAERIGHLALSAGLDPTVILKAGDQLSSVEITESMAI